MNRHRGSGFRQEVALHHRQDVYKRQGYNDAARQVFQFKDVRTMRDLVIPITAQLVPIFIAILLWLATRGTRPRAGAVS